MAWIELAEKRGRKEKHYFDASTGQHQAIFTIHDQHYHDGQAWQDVDESLVNDGADGFSKKCDKTRHIFRVASGGVYRWYPRRDVLAEYVTISGIEYYTNRWRQLNLPAAVWKQQGAEWDLTNLYASLTNTWRRVKAEFILKDNTAPARLRFAVVLTGLTLDGWTVKSGSTVVGSIDPPTAFDASGLAVPIAATYADGYIEWSADTTGAAYPVSVDPTFTDGYGGDATTAKDAYISNQSGATDWNYGAAATIYVNSAASPGTRKGVIGFDLSSISATATCDSATLYLYSARSGTTRNHLVYSLASGVATWTEGTGNGSDTNNGVSWNEYKADTAWPGSAGASTSGTDYESGSLGTIVYPNSATNTEASVALTASRIEDWFGATNTNYGLLIAGDASAGVDRDWHSSDASTTGYRPKLVVVYTSSGGVTVSPAARTAVAARVNPTVVLGSVSVSPAAVSAVCGKVDPTVLGGGTIVAPAAVSARAITPSSHTVISGSVAVSPEASPAVASTAVLAVVLGSLSVSPSATSAIAAGVDPAVSAGSVSISPAARSAVCDTAAPTIGLSSMVVAPAARSAVCATTAPTVDISSPAIVDIDHEDGTLAEYTSTVTDGGDLSVGASGALGGTDYGLRCLIDDTNTIYGTYTLGTASTTGDLRCRFYIDPNSLSMPTGSSFQVAYFMNGSGNSIASVTLYYTNAAGYQIQATLIDDAGTSRSTGYYAITDASHYVEFYLQRASTSSSNDGSIQLWIDGTSKETVSGRDNYDRFVNFRYVWFGVCTSPMAGTTGTLYLDELKANATGAEIGQLGTAVTPSAVSAITGRAGPTVVMSSITVAPAARSAIAHRSNPAVKIGLTLAPSAVSAVTAVSGPAVRLGSIAITPATALVVVLASIGGVQIVVWEFVRLESSMRTAQAGDGYMRTAVSLDVEL